MNKMKEYENQLSEALKEATPPKGWGAWARLMREEVSSKLFFKQFKPGQHAHGLCGRGKLLLLTPEFVCSQV